MLFSVLLVHLASAEEVFIGFKSRIDVSGSDFLIHLCFFSELSSSSGGAIKITGSGIKISIETSSFRYCSCVALGGAIHTSLTGGLLNLSKLCASNCYTTSTSGSSGQISYSLGTSSTNNNFNLVSFSRCQSVASAYQNHGLYTGYATSEISNNNSTDNNINSCSTYGLINIVKAHVVFTNIINNEAIQYVVFAFHSGIGNMEYTNIIDNLSNQLYGAFHLTQSNVGTLTHCCLMQNSIKTFDLFSSSLKLENCCVYPYTFSRGSATVINVAYTQCAASAIINNIECHRGESHQLTRKSLFNIANLVFFIV